MKNKGEVLTVAALVWAMVAITGLQFYIGHKQRQTNKSVEVTHGNSGNFVGGVYTPAD